MRCFKIVTRLAIFIIGSASATAQQAEKPTWERIITAGDIFHTRDEAKGIVLDGGMWLRGGTPGGSDLLYDTWFSTDGKRWTRKDEHSSMHSYALPVSVDQKTMLGVGEGNVFQFHPQKKWQEVSSGHAFHRPEAAVVVDQTIVCLDRHPQSAQDELTQSRIWSSRDGGKSWNVVNDSAPFGPRRPTAMAYFQKKLWVIGGASGEAREKLPTEYYAMKLVNDVWSSEDGGKTWIQSDVKQKWVPRIWAGYASDADRIWIVGGFDNIYEKERIADLDDVWYTEDGEHWILQGKGPFTPRHAPTCYIHDGYLWLVAGKENTSPSSGQHLNEVWRLPLSGKQ